MKTCTRCGVSRDQSLFSGHKTTRDRLQTHCKPCVKERNIAYNIEHAERLKAHRKERYAREHAAMRDIAKAWADENREHVRAQNRAYYWKNHERRKAYNAAWQALNKERLRPYYAEKMRRRFASIRKATPSWADPTAILEIYEACKRISDETGVRHHVDHIVPIVSPVVCGLHVQSNLQILSAWDNLSKGNKLIAE